MATRKSSRKGSEAKLQASWREPLSEFLIETAERRPELETVMLHIAELADLPAVRAEITRLRKYAARRNGRRVA